MVRMTGFYKLLLTLGIAAAGSYLGNPSRIPVGALVGYLYGRNAAHVNGRGLVSI